MRGMPTRTFVPNARTVYRAGKTVPGQAGALAFEVDLGDCR